MNHDTLLHVENASSRYGRVTALRDVGIEVRRGELVALIGANGAGKTTLLNVISGVQPLSGGQVSYAGRALEHTPAPRRVKLGIVQVPEGRQIFSAMTVRENLELGAYTRPRANTDRMLEQTFALFPSLASRRSERAGSLSGGEQQMVAIGRALMSEPELLLLDEPSLGLSPQMVSFIFDSIRELNKSKGMSILLVEQNASLALQFAHRAYVLETGCVALVGPAAELAKNPDVQATYLGA